MNCIIGIPSFLREPGQQLESQHRTLEIESLSAKKKFLFTRAFLKTSPCCKPPQPCGKIEQLWADWTRCFGKPAHKRWSPINHMAAAFAALKEHAQYEDPQDFECQCGKFCCYLDRMSLCLCWSWQPCHPVWQPFSTGRLRSRLIFSGSQRSAS